MFLIVEKVYMTSLLRGSYSLVWEKEPFTDLMNSKNVYTILRDVMWTLNF